MRKHLNTLFVATENAYLTKKGETVCVRVEDSIKLRVPLINLEGIVCLGNILCSPQLLGACAEAGVTVSFLTPYGKFLAAVVGFSPGNVVLRRAQYRAADDPLKCCSVSRNIVIAKIANTRSVLLRAARESSDDQIRESLGMAAKRLLPAFDKLGKASELDSIRGIEGSSAKLYFEHFNALLKKDAGFCMEGRSRRPPLDEVNALLSFVYSLLCHDARSACESSGLDAAVGFLHRDRSGRPGLALDLVEDLRPYFADRLVLSLINRRQITPADFICSEAGAFQLTDDARKKVLQSYQKRKEAEITHPFIAEKVTLGILLHIQARLLARYLRGDLDEYPSFIWK